MAARTERARAIGLFRYQLIREAADPALSSRARGRLVREIAARRAHRSGRAAGSGSPGTPWTAGSGRGAAAGSTRWSPIRASPRRGCRAEVLELAAALKRENPARTAAQVRRILRAQLGWAPGGADAAAPVRRRPASALPGALAAGAGGEAVFGRFEADAPERAVDRGRPARPAHRRPQDLPVRVPRRSFPAIVGHRLGFAEDTVRLAAALRPALASRGVPDGVYVDNGSAFVDAWLLRACAKLGIRLIHSTPGRPQGRGKIERFFRTVSEQFLVEITGEHHRRRRRRRRAAAGTGSPI